jgi:HK97 family phage prohead protease
MKTQDLSLQIKAADDNGEFEGYASTFGGSPDAYGDVVESGAFIDSLVKHRREGTMPLMLWAHDPNEPIGVWHEFAEDGKGLWARGTLLKGVQKADEAYIRLKAGAVRGLSIGYREIDAGPEGNVRKLRKLDLIEVSVVSMPANRRARVNNVKGDRWADLEAFAQALRDGEPPPIKDFEQFLRDAGVPKSMAVRIASVGYAKAIRSDSEGETTAKTAGLDEALAQLRAAAAGFTMTP